ncbi:cupin domain-containing protein [Salibacterium salarium]|uniref:Cupin domain-containing protein n=1 Tax=Salibacterium salarium TaxID=284579 RepID=A0A428N6Z5_9BACI|nr:cupin domain-containing protein [Salibacterium salarium]RSL34089.1 cupin domain-containing protein [Salibacterium salarium]
MYYVPNMNPYPYYVNAPMYAPDVMARNNQHVVESILAGIKGEAEAIDFYSRLADAAPNEEHKNDILRALEDEKVHLQQFTDLYISLTGRQPVYDIDNVTFNTYNEGLKKAYEAELKDYEEYRKSYAFTQHTPFRDVFLRAGTDEIEHAERFNFLSSNEKNNVEIKDYGAEPFVVNIEEATKQNDTFRTALWTGENLQVTLMSIGVGEDIGLEVHPTVDQFLRIEQGQGLVQMGDSEDQLDFEENVSDDYAIMVPAGKWHNLTNTGRKPLKLYTIYAPPEHPFGTVHETKADAMAAEENNH